MQQAQEDHHPPLRAQHGVSAQVHHLGGVRVPRAAARPRWVGRSLCGQGGAAPALCSGVGS